MEKLPCSDCGTQILPTTAARNGGRCMPCASGTRAAIEAGKEYYRTQRELDKSDPVRLLWRSLVERVHGTQAGYSGLARAEKLYFAVGLLDGDVYNGGFDQYFFNSSSDYYREAVIGLEEMGAAASLDLLLRAKQVVFGFRDVPENTIARRGLWGAMSDSQTRRLDDLDKLFWKDPDGLCGRVEAFLQQNGLIRHVA